MSNEIWKTISESIRKACTGKIKTCGSFKWEYYDDTM